MISPEDILPYDRTLLTKTLPFGDAKKFALRDQSFLTNADIDILKDSVYSIHSDIKTITLEKGQPIKYDKLLIATGGQVLKPKIKGIDAKHVYYLRSHLD
jgi:NAD(P)H-nitrite reductase large subunit